jgi:TRAP-type C4-dicarboxylate transport system substrate-binding protein
MFVPVIRRGGGCIMVESGSPVSRRRFISTALAVGGAAALAGCTPAPEPVKGPEKAPAVNTGQSFRWRVQHIEASTTANYKIFEQWAADIDKASSGRLKLQLFPAGTLSPNEGTFDAVSEGQFEMGVSSPGYHRAKMPEVEAFNLPHGFRNLTDLMVTYLQYGLRDFYRESYAKHNLYLLDFAAARGVLLISTKPVTSVEDLSKLKIRTHTTYAQFVEKLGATTVFIPGGEVYTGLAAGTADAATWGDETTLRDFKWYEVAKYLVYPMLLEAMLSYDTIVNMKSWEALPIDLQVIMQNASARYLLLGNYVQAMQLKDQSIAEMQQAGLQTTHIRQEDGPKLIQAAEAVWSDIAAKNPRSKQAMKIITDYFRTQGYTKFKID